MTHEKLDELYALAKQLVSEPYGKDHENLLLRYRWAANEQAIIALIDRLRELELKLRDEISDHNDTRWNLTQARAALNKEST